jgi:phosphatidylglycerol:prolipoprotein diacylglycerol transferase
MIPWFQYTVVHIGPVPIQVWGFFVALGMVLTFWILAKRAPMYGIQKEGILDAAFLMIFFGLVFSRLFHVFFYEFGYYAAHPIDIFKIWQGGLSSFGGLCGAGVGFWYAVRKKKIAKEKLLKAADLLGFAALFGWIVGRIGCFMIHDHMGRPCDCFLAINTPDGPRLEMALLEILALLPLALIFFIARKKSMPEGWFVSVLFVYYGLARFILDFFRATDIEVADVRYLGLTPAQYFAILLVGAGVWLYIRKSKK